MSGTKVPPSQPPLKLVNSSRMQVTNDPGRQEKKESSGLVTSDSLAAESLKSGGDFAATTGAAASGVPSKSTTANNTDTSGATVLPAAVDAEARQAQEGWNEAAQLNAGRSLATGGGATAGHGATTSDLLAEQQKPKGQNVKEGGFDGSAPNASFNTAIGTNKDPGRAALEGFQKSNADAVSGGGAKQTNLSSDGQYDSLKDASA